MIKLKMSAAPAPSQFELDGVIRGYHVYMDDWDARSGELAVAEVDLGNAHDVHAVALKLNGEVVGHVPKKMSRIFHFFLLRGGSIEAVVIGPRQYASALVQGGLDIPCKYIFTCSNDKGLVKKLKKLIKKEETKE